MTPQEQSLRDRLGLAEARGLDALLREVSGAMRLAKVGHVNRAGARVLAVAMGQLVAEATDLDRALDRAQKLELARLAIEAKNWNVAVLFAELCHDPVVTRRAKAALSK